MSRRVATCSERVIVLSTVFRAARTPSALCVVAVSFETRSREDRKTLSSYNYDHRLFTRVRLRNLRSTFHENIPFNVIICFEAFGAKKSFALFVLIDQSNDAKFDTRYEVCCTLLLSQSQSHCYIVRARDGRK